MTWAIIKSSLVFQQRRYEACPAKKNQKDYYFYFRTHKTAKWQQDPVILQLNLTQYFQNVKTIFVIILRP